MGKGVTGGAGVATMFAVAVPSIVSDGRGVWVKEGWMEGVKGSDVGRVEGVGSGSTTGVLSDSC